MPWTARLLVVVPLLLAAPAAAQDDRCPDALAGSAGDDGLGCPTDFDPYHRLAFDSERHRLWYKRFWDGECSAGTRGCVPGWINGYWCDHIDDLLEDLSAVEAGPLRTRLWLLGYLIGHEWSRDNDRRRIDSDHIGDWLETLYDAVETQRAAGLDRAIDSVMALARDRLAVE